MANGVPGQMTEADIENAVKELDKRLQERLDSITNINKSLEDTFKNLDKDLSQQNNQNDAINHINAKIQKEQERSLKELDRIYASLHDKAKTIGDEAKKQQAILQLEVQKNNLSNAIIKNNEKYIDSLKTKIKRGSQNFDFEQQGQQAETDAKNQSGINAAAEAFKKAGDAGKNINYLSIESFNNAFKDITTGNGVGVGLMGLYTVLRFGKTLDSLGISRDGLLSGVNTSILASFAPLLGTFKNIGNTIQGYILTLKSLFGVISGIGQGIVSIPLRIMEAASEMGHEIKRENVELFNQLEKLQDSFRQSSTAGRSMASMNAQLQGRRVSYLNPNSDVARLYGATGDNLIEKQMDETAGIIKSMGVRAELMARSVTKNVTAANSAIANYYYKAKKLMNLSDDDMGKLTNMAISLGKSFPQVFDEISQSTANVAKRFSLDFKMMASDVMTLRNDIVNFGHKSAEELALVAGHVRQMGVSMSDAMAVFNKFNTFEDAATTAAQLSQTFGMVVDSMELLKAQSPDEILQQYKDAFIASGKSFETMDRFSKSLILQQTGLSDQAAQALFSAENAGKTYEEIMKDVEANDPTERQARNMEEMKDAIVELKMTLSKDFKSFFEAMQDGFTKKLFANPSIRRSMESMAKAMDNIFLKFTQIDVKKFQPAIDRMMKGIDKLTNFITSPKFIKYLENVAFAIMDIVDGFTSLDDVIGRNQMEKGMTNLYKNISPIFEFLGSFGLELMKSIGSSLLNMLPGVIGSINNFIDSILNYFNKNNPIDTFSNSLFSPQSNTKLAKALDAVLKKIFGDANGADKKGLIGRMKEMFDVLFNSENGLVNKLMSSMKQGFINLFNDQEFKNSIGSIIETIISAIDFKSIGTIVKSSILGSWSGVTDEQLQMAENALKTGLGGLKNAVAPQPAQDLIISDKGSFTLDSKDEIMALKPGGAIEEYMKNVANLTSARSEITLSNDNLMQLKNVLVEAMKTAAEGSKQDKELVINLDSQKVGSVLIKGGLVTMMTNPNIAGNQPTLNTNSINTFNGQTYANTFRNS